VLKDRMRLPDATGLISVFEDALFAVGQPDNDFSWSGWPDQADATEEIEGILSK
jgi:hypothetical protein